MFVCGWCAYKCLTRVALDFHFVENPECGANRNVNSASQQKNMTDERQIEYPGEATLDLVESRRPSLRVLREND